MNDEEEIEIEARELDALWDKAIYNARKAFEKTFSDENYDSAYWTIKIVSHSLTSDFDGILDTKTWDEYGRYNLKEKIQK